ncbi:lantibiotic dehydratase [Streptomyces sp. NPDC046939]|uniref:lantibiotic dehydratase n=1 Tax=Streptomyces sp. NPDC046939 TaxID=3155376 RepID=UPI0033DE10A5
MTSDRLHYRALGWAVLRAPLFPVESCPTLAHPSSDPDWRARNPSGRSLLPDDARVRRALAVGSEDLYDALRRTPSSDRAARRLRGKLLRYAIRMCARPTPYGLFAGVGLTTWGDETTVALADAPRRTRTRPDMGLLLDLVHTLEAREEVREQLRWYANPTAFVRAGRVFLSEQARGAGGQEGGSVSVRATRMVRAALDAARTPVSFAQLVAHLTQCSGSAEAGEARAAQLLHDLWRQTFLLTELRPPLTVPDPARWVSDQLARVPAALAQREALDHVLAGADAWDADPHANAAQYRALGHETAALAPKPTHRKRPPLQVDSALRLHTAKVSRRLAHDAAQAAELLLRLNPAEPGSPGLHAYRQSFEARYGSHREVPLLELLDREYGLGPPGHHRTPLTSLTPQRSRALLDLALEALHQRRRAVELHERHVEALATRKEYESALPPSLDLSLLVAADSSAAVDTGDYLVVVGPNLGGSAAGRNLGRFGHLLAEDGLTALRDTARAEEAVVPHDLLAEVVYLPAHARSANVAVRPAVRTHEITLDTTPGVAPDARIPVDELVVGVNGNRLVLRWARTGASVLPCAGHMLTARQGSDLVRFLDDLSREGCIQLAGFDWGPASEFPFLPRVQVGRIVLALAQWRMPAAESAEALPAEHQEKFRDALARWRVAWDVPRHVFLSVGDNRLLLDLDDPLHVEELRTEVRGSARTFRPLLQEALPGPDQAWLPGPGGRFAGELVVPLVRTSPPRTHAPTDVSHTMRRTKPPPRVHPSLKLRPPGSEWLYAKLYVPPSLEEELISGPMRAFTEGTIGAGLADGWFFIRYSDPEPHLRLRFRGAPDRLIGVLLPALLTWAQDMIGDGMCTRLVLDTYEREVERFGGPQGTAVMEEIFMADSRAVADLLHLERDGRSPADRLTLMVRSIDDLLTGFGLTAEQRLAWYRGRVATRRPSGEEFRRRKELLRDLIGDGTALANRPVGDRVSDILKLRRAETGPPAKKMRMLWQTDDLWLPPEQLYGSAVHLHANRIRGGGHSAEELALGLLLRTHDSLRHAPLPSKSATRARNGAQQRPA